jgi:hypothetical protein
MEKHTIEIGKNTSGKACNTNGKLCNTNKKDQILQCLARHSIREGKTLFSR